MMKKMKMMKKKMKKKMTSNNEESIPFTDISVKEDGKPNEDNLLRPEEKQQLFQVLNQQSTAIESLQQLPKIMESFSRELISIRGMMEERKQQDINNLESMNTVTASDLSNLENISEPMEQTNGSRSIANSPYESPQPQNPILRFLSGEVIQMVNQLVLNLYQMYAAMKKKDEPVESEIEKRIKKMFYKQVGHELFKMERRLGISDNTRELVHNTIS